MASDALYAALADALSKPSKKYQAAQEGLAIPGKILQGYTTGADFVDAQRKRKLQQQTLGEALGGLSPEAGIMNFTGETGQAQDKNLSTLAELLKAKREQNQKGLQFVGTQGKSGVLFDPNKGAVSSIPLPNSNDPIIPKAVGPTLSPFADPATGAPLQFIPGRGLSPTNVSGGSGGTPVLKQGNEQAIGDVALMQSQAGNIDKLFDAYSNKGPIAARAQATPIGNVLDPQTKQLENALKLSAFTFGGKNLTGQEKQVVFGAFFPSFTDNAASLEQKRSLLKSYFSGKVDLLQAANLLGPAGAPLRGMLQGKIRPDASQSTGDPEADAAIAQVNSANISQNEKAARISGIRSAAGRK